ncbi:MAG: DUF1667 domain-containing protein [Lachnospiraceae bacterium]|nr:DUF1667 domain-containing protein [Lachnospiraceae bacterium]
MTESIELTCIGCPLGCRITVKKDQNEILDITGFTCKRGEAYARTEVLSPVRTVTSTVRVNNGERPVVAVKTAEPVPKDRIRDCMDVIYNLKTDAPVAAGDVICDDIAGTGVALVATADCAVL